jgi:serine/threonine protein kinase
MKFNIIMEPLVERDLSTVIAEKGNGIELDKTQICTIGCDMFDGLAHVHEEGFIHNDVKPGNTGVIRKPFGAVILDVGICEQMQDSRDHNVGTVLWFSPERIMLKRHYMLDMTFDLRRLPAYTSKADVWAAALCCLSCCSTEARR